MTIFTHVTVGTNDLNKARQFYDAVLAPLGLKRLKDFGDGGSCWGQSTEEFMVLKPADGKPATHANGGTISFEAPSRAAVAAVPIGSPQHPLALKEDRRANKHVLAADQRACSRKLLRIVARQIADDHISIDREHAAA